MKHYQKTHGAVSVFLVLILVPCLVFTSIFVDLGRSHMSKAMAESSADLALNTLMTNYDGDLNEWYGLIASTQDINKYYDTATQYFLRSMSSQKIEGYETSLISDYAQSAFDTTKVSDLLKCDVQTAPSEIIGPVSGANLSNAALMKVQVIEFMKYRGPIEIIRGVFGRFMGAAESKHNGEDGAPNDGGSVTDAQKNEDDVKYKQEFYKAEGELLAAAFHTYVAIRKYYRDEVSKPYDGSAPFNNSRLKEYTERLDGYRETYRELHGQYVRYFANTGELSIYKHPNFKLTDYQQTDPKKAFEKDPKGLFKSKFKKDKDESGNEIYTITGTTLHDLMDDLKQAIKDYDTARSNLAEKGQELLNTMYGSESDPNAISPIQWWVKMDKAINSSGLSKKAKEAGEKVLILYQAMYLAGSDSVEIKEPFNTPCNKPEDKKTEKDKDHERDADARRADMVAQVEELYKKYLAPSSLSGSDGYTKSVLALEKVSNDFWSKINPDSCYVTMNGKQVTVTQALNNIGSDLSAMREYFQRMVDKLNVAINGDKKDTKSLKELKSLADTYRTNLSNWSKEAHEADTDMKRYDADAIDGKLTVDEKGRDISGQNVDDAAKEITAAAVTALSNRLSNIKSQLETVIKAIDSMKYGNAKLVEIKTLNDMRKKVGNKISSDHLQQNWLVGQINDYAESTFQDIISPNGAHVVELQHLSDNDYNPDINPEQNNSVNTPKLYVYFHSKWSTCSDNQVDEATKQADEANEKAEALKDGVLDKLGGDDSDRVDIKKEFSGDSSYGAGTFLSSIVELIKVLVNGDFTKIRDDLYTTTYMLKMFTWDTYTNEGKFNLLSGEDQNNIGLGSKDSYYNKEEIKKAWASESLEDTYNKSLTNKMKNKANNAAWQAELEYILYGKDTCKANVRAAYGDIYVIRLAMNTISAFMLFFPTGANETSRNLDLAATALTSATLGIIPPPVWKCLMIVILALAESCMDLLRLSAGFPVELFKTKEDDFYLAIKASNIGDIVSELCAAVGAGESLKKNGSSGIFYGDYLTLFLYLGLSGHGSLEECMYQRMAEVIQTNLRHHEEIPESYSLTKSQVYFKLNAVIRVRPLMITLPIFNDPAYENDLNTKTDWCTYTVTTTRGYS